MRIAAVLLAIIGGLLALAIGYLFWGGSFGQIGVRVPSYVWLVLIAFVGAIVGALFAIWRVNIGAVLITISVGALVVLDLQLVHWVATQATERDVGISAMLTRASIGFLLPIAVIGLAAILAWLCRWRSAIVGKPQ